MRKLFIFIVVILGSICLGLYMQQDSGYILIAFKSWIVEMSLWTGLLLLIFGIWLVNKAFKFFKNIINLPGYTRKWLANFRQRKLYQQTSEGLLKLAEGDFKKAESLLIKAASKQDKPLINYLTAAKAAQELSDINKRDEYLRKAFESSPTSGLSIGLMRASLQLANHENEAALASLNHLLHEYGYNKIVLKQLVTVYLNLKDWQKVIELLPALYKYDIYTKQELLGYEILAAVNYLKMNSVMHDNSGFSSSMDPVGSVGEQLQEKLDFFYNREISKQARQDYRVVIAYVESMAFIAKASHTILRVICLELILKTLKLIDKQHQKDQQKNQMAQQQLLGLYGDVATTEEGFVMLEKYLKSDYYNIDLLFVLGKIALKLEEYDKAYQYLNQSKQIAENVKTNLPIDYYLAYVLLKLGKQESGLNLFLQRFKNDQRAEMQY